MKKTKVKKVKKYPASCVVHWPTGPVKCCDRHANELLTLGNLLGSHIVATKLIQEDEDDLEQCGNCVNESNL